MFLLFLNELPDIVQEEMEADDHNEEPSDNDIVIYADDNTPITASKDPLVLETKLQEEANAVTNWFSKNDMICSSDKTKLLIIGTNMNRKIKLERRNLSLKVNICGEVKHESTSEKLLGIVINNTATFKHHMYGDEENQGLMKQLSTRVGIIKKLRKYLPPARLRVLYEGVFSSKMLYGMAVWGRIWQIPGSMDEDQSTRTSPSLTKEDVRKLQVLQNKCMRLMTDSDYKTPTRVLLAQTNLLSVHQQMAHVSLSQVYNIRKTKLATYHYKRIFGDTGDGTTNRI